MEDVTSFVAPRGQRVVDMTVVGRSSSAVLLLTLDDGTVVRHKDAWLRGSVTHDVGEFEMVPDSEPLQVTRDPFFLDAAALGYLGEPKVKRSAKLTHVLRTNIEAIRGGHKDFRCGPYGGITDDGDVYLPGWAGNFDDRSTRRHQRVMERYDRKGITLVGFGSNDGDRAVSVVSYLSDRSEVLVLTERGNLWSVSKDGFVGDEPLIRDVASLSDGRHSAFVVTGSGGLWQVGGAGAFLGVRQRVDIEGAVHVSAGDEGLCLTHKDGHADFYPELHRGELEEDPLPYGFASSMPILKAVANGAGVYGLAQDGSLLVWRV